MDMMTSWPWLGVLRGISWIPLLLIGIHGIGPTTGLPMTTAIALTTPLIATALVVISLTLGYNILGIWLTPELLSRMAKLITVVSSSS